MKKLLLLLLTLFLYNIGNSQTLNWAKQIGGAGLTTVQSTSTLFDSNGNSYYCGYFSGSADFDPGAGVFTLSCPSNQYNGFLIKLDGAGALVWAKQFGVESIPAIEIDHTNSLILTGVFSGTVDFDPNASVYNMTTSGLLDVFVLKLSIDGNFIWAKQLGGAGNDNLPKISVDNSNNIIIGGFHAGTGDFDPGIGVFNLSTSDQFTSNSFIVKLDANGDFNWAKQYFSSGNDNAVYQVKFDGLGNVIAAGNFKGNTNFDPGLSNTSLTSINTIDFYITKTDPNGNLLWAKQFGQASPLNSFTILPVSSGNIYCAGNFVSTNDFDPGSGVSNLTPIGNSDGFISKLNADGTLNWVKQIGGSGSGISYSDLTIDNRERIYLTGYFVGTIDFDPNAAAFNLSYNFVNTYGTTFIQSITKDGEFVWAKNFTRIIGSTLGNNTGTKIKVTNDFKINLTGFFSATVSLGFGNTQLVATGLTDSYFIQINDNPVIPTAANMTWNGSISTTWNVPDNWTPYGVPTAITNVSIPAALTNYPKMTGDSTINGLNMVASTSLDFNGKKLTVLSDFDINGATLNNTDGASDIVINFGGGTTNYFRGSTINDHITINQNSNTNFYEAFQAANTYNFDANFNINGNGEFNVCYGLKSDFKGNLTVNRTVAGQSYIFRVGAIGVGGNFSYTNNAGGNTQIGQSSSPITVGGKFDIASNPAGNPNFDIYQITNNIAGGVINIQNPGTTIIADNNLKVSSLTVNGFSSGGVTDVRNNIISGDLVMTEAGTNSIYTYFRGNTIGGNTIYTGNTAFPFYEAFQVADTFTGNFDLIQNGTGEINLCYGLKSDFKGNVSVSRMASGSSYIFNVGAMGVTGNFSYTNNMGGNTVIGHTNFPFTIDGKFDVTSNPVGNPSFEIYQITNNTAGGIINLQNSGTTIIANNNLKVNSLTVSGFSSGGTTDVRNNVISGDLNMTEASTNSIYTYLRGNTIGGNTVYTANSNNILYEGFQVTDSFIGDATFIRNNGTINLAYGVPTYFYKGLILNSSTGINFIQPISFKGVTNGIIEQLGIQPLIVPTINLEKANGGKVTLKDSLTITNSIAFTNGKIGTSLGNELIFPDNINYTGYSDASFVEGPVKKVGNDAFVFPVGGDGKQAPISISAPTSLSDKFRAQYLHATPTNPTLKVPTIDHISLAEYWLLDRPAGSSNVFVTLSWGAGRTGLVNNIADLRIAHFDEGIWKNEGNGGITGNSVAGTIISQFSLGSFSPFTLASVTANSNPLPLSLLSFTGKNENNANLLQFITTDEVSLSHFEIERSENAKIFEKIGEIKAHGGSFEKVSYEFKDSQLTGRNSQIFYRLKMVDLDQKFKYSKIINVENKIQSEPTIYPNPANDYFSLSENNRNILEVELQDLTGKIIKKMKHRPDNQYTILDLPKSTYLLKINSGDNFFVKKLIIQ